MWHLQVTKWLIQRVPEVIKRNDPWPRYLDFSITFLERGKCIIMAPFQLLDFSILLDSFLLKLLCGNTWFFRSESNKNSFYKSKHVINKLVELHVIDLYNLVKKFFKLGIIL